MALIPKSNNISNDVRKLQRKIDAIPRQASVHFKKITPIDTGNARSKTSLQRQDTIVANYPYANRLNEGYSKQAPGGMTKPTIEFIRKSVKKILGR